MQFSIQFTKSPSRNFKVAFKLAQDADDFEEDVEKKLYTASFLEESLYKFLELADLVSGWKSARILFGSRQIKQTEVWQLRRVYDCHLQKQEFERQEFYCSVDHSGNNLLFPCKFIRLYRYNFYEQGIYGNWDEKGNFQVDEDRLLFEVERQLRTHFSYYCPSLDQSAIMSAVRNLPEQLPQKNEGSLHTLSQWDTTLSLNKLPEAAKNLGSQWDEMLEDIADLDDL